jgi:hypothetical protein
MKFIMISSLIHRPQVSSFSGGGEWDVSNKWGGRRFRPGHGVLLEHIDLSWATNSLSSSIITVQGSHWAMISLVIASSSIGIIV